MLYILVIITLIVIDQVFKYYVVKNYSFKKSVCLVKEKIYIKVIKNTGAAFSLLAGRQTLLIVITTPLVIFLFIYLIFLNRYEDYVLFKLALSILLGGAIGNLIDRVRLKYVVDFIYIRIKRFPIFNFADLFILIGILILIFLIISNRIDAFILF